MKIDDMPEEMRAFVVPLSNEICAVMQKYLSFMIEKKGEAYGLTITVNALLDITANVIVSLGIHREGLTDDLLAKFKFLIVAKGEEISPGE